LFLSGPTWPAFIILARGRLLYADEVPTFRLTLSFRPSFPFPNLITSPDGPSHPRTLYI